MAKGSREEGILRGLGTRILRMQKGGGSVPSHVRAAARRAIQGGARSGDAEALRGFLGISRTGAGEARNARRQFRSSIDPIQNIGMGIEMMANTAARGGTVSAASLGVVKSVVDEAARALQSKVLKNFADKAAASLSRSVLGQRLGLDAGMGARALQKTRGALRMGSIYLEAAMAGGEIGLAIHDAGVKRAQNESVRFDTARKHGIRQDLVTKEALRMQATADEARGSVSFALKKYMDVDISGTDEDVADRVKKRGELRSRSREHFKALTGRDPGALLQQERQRRGMWTSQLDQKTGNQLLDDELSKAIDPERQMNSDYVNTKMALRNPFEKMTDWWGGEAAEQQRRRGYAEQAVEKKVATAEKRDEVRKKAAADMRAARSEAEQLKHDVLQAQSAAAWTGYRSRRQAWANH
ncbi:MAG: hypothetical protein AMXMBFR7_16190 [Planctomycetota bacterium]